MNQREALLILFEATLELPETTPLRRARRWAEKRLEVLRVRYMRMKKAKTAHAWSRHATHCSICSNVEGDACEIGKELYDAMFAAYHAAEAQRN